jgi:16S rRNA (cytidine1402-2'-O)-methyltransferase
VLYLISTPIGNLSDLTFRAVETMQQCDYLLCEDTRRSKILLDHYQIKKPLKSFHIGNEDSRLYGILDDLKQGKAIGLLSDGGTPVLCDPGFPLIQRCIEEQISFTALPGPCALIQALVLSGFPAHPFQFLGFLPRNEMEIRCLLPYVLAYPGVSLFYESPQRLVATLTILNEIAPQARIAIARELTKTFEEVFRSTVEKALAHFTCQLPRGEFVLMVQGIPPTLWPTEPRTLVEELLQTYKIPLQEAIKTAAHFLKLPKQSVYKLFHHNRQKMDADSEQDQN